MSRSALELLARLLDDRAEDLAAALLRLLRCDDAGQVYCDVSGTTPTAWLHATPVRKGVGEPLDRVRWVIDQRGLSPREPQMVRPYVRMHLPLSVLRLVAALGEAEADGEPVMRGGVTWMQSREIGRIEDGATAVVLREERIHVQRNGLTIEQASAEGDPLARLAFGSETLPWLLAAAQGWLTVIDLATERLENTLMERTA